MARRTGTDQKAKSNKKQAVVIIHGIGEQVPMETLRGFVDAVWVTDEDLIDEDRVDGDTGQPRRRNPVWTKPDKRNRSFELRRITTEFDRNQTRTDFFEYYWAHMMHGTTLEQVLAWIVELFTRARDKVPGNVRKIYTAVRWTVALVAIAIIAAMVWFQSLWTLIVSFASLGVVAFFVRLLSGKVVNVLVTRVGDVVRYVKPDPVNVGRRQEIREHGVRLLETLMGVTPQKKREFQLWHDEGADPDKMPEWSAEYDRIIVVGHSLGSIVAYDLLKYLYARVNRLGIGGEPDQPAREELERRCRQALIDEDGDERAQDLPTNEFRQLQRAAFIEQRAQGSPWIISDFVTLGAALTHAEFLMAKDEADLVEQQSTRILPTCPPVLEWDRHTDKDHFTYRVPDEETEEAEAALAALKTAKPQHFRYPHHAAHFAFTRWTNLYSPSNGFLKGDIVSGPLAEHFAMRDRHRGSTNDKRVRGIKDVAVLEHSDANEKPPNRFTHLDYWAVDSRERIPKLNVPEHIRELRKAVDLLFTEDQPGLDDTLD